MSFPTQNKNRDCCGDDECERPICEECKESCVGSATCTKCETDYCTECEVGGDDGTPEQEWVCDSCLDEEDESITCEKCKSIVPDEYLNGKRPDEMWVECSCGAHDGWYCPNHSPGNDCSPDKEEDIFACYCCGEITDNDDGVDCPRCDEAVCDECMIADEDDPHCKTDRCKKCAEEKEMCHNGGGSCDCKGDSCYYDEDEVTCWRVYDSQWFLDDTGEIGHTNDTNEEEFDTLEEARAEYKSRCTVEYCAGEIHSIYLEECGGDDEDDDKEDIYPIDTIDWWERMSVDEFILSKTKKKIHKKKPPYTGRIRKD